MSSSVTSHSSKSYLSEEGRKQFLKLPIEKKINKVVVLYGRKYCPNMFKGKKMNWGIFLYNKNVIVDNMEETDVNNLYLYLNTVEKSPIYVNIYEVLKKATDYAKKQFAKKEEEKRWLLTKPVYKQFSVDDLL